MNNEKMTTKELRSGYVVELRNGVRFLVLRMNESKFEKIIVNNTQYFALKEYDNSLCHKYMGPGCDSLDIVKVWGLSKCPLTSFSISDLNDRPLLWERPTAKKMTLDELEKILGYRVEIVKEDKKEVKNVWNF